VDRADIDYFFVYRFSSALCCSGSNRRLIVVPLSFPKLRRLQKHRTSSTSIGLTACPLSFLSRLRVLYLPWADFVPVPSSVGFVSTTSPHQPPLLLPTTRQLHLEASSTEASSTVQPRTACLPPFLISTTPPTTICVSTTPYVNILRKYSARLKISTMSTGYGPRILGRCRPTHSNAIRDSGPQETGGGNLAMHPRSLDSSWRG